MGTVGRFAFHKLAAYSLVDGNQALENMYCYLLPWNACVILSTTRRIVPEGKNIIQSKI